MKNTNKEIATPDIGLAAALITAKHQLQYLNKNNLRRVEFVFSCVPQIEKDISGFWNDTLELNARSYFENLKMLKHRIYET